MNTNDNGTSKNKTNEKSCDRRDSKTHLPRLHGYPAPGVNGEEGSFFPVAQGVQVAPQHLNPAFPTSQHQHFGTILNPSTNQQDFNALVTTQPFYVTNYFPTQVQLIPQSSQAGSFQFCTNQVVSLSTGTTRGQASRKENAPKMKSRKRPREMEIKNPAKKRDNSSSKYLGVFYGKTIQAWVTRKMVNRVSRHLGYFNDEIEAARAYDFFEIERRMKTGDKSECKNILKANPTMRLNFTDSVDEYAKYLEKGNSYFKTKHIKAKAEKTSKYLGVCWHKSNKAWKASLVVDKKNIHVGYYSDEEEAARSYDAKAIFYKGNKAILNFPVKNPMN